MDRYLEQVKATVLRHLAGRDATVYLFGSRARGDARPTSDVDVGIVARPPLPPALMAELREALEESTVPYRVDLVDLAEAPPEYRRAVEREGVRWSA